MTDQAATFEGWAILELMGHRRLGGYVSEQVIAGGAFIRIDVPGDGVSDKATQFYSPQAVYAITPTSEETARRVAKLSHPAPVQRWELPPATDVPAREVQRSLDLSSDDPDDADEDLDDEPAGGEGGGA